MKITGALLLLTAASTVFAAGVRDDVTYKDCVYNRLTHCPGDGWSEVIKNGRCHCEKQKTTAQRVKENTEQCSYYEKLCFSDGIHNTRGSGKAIPCAELKNCSRKSYKAMCRRAVVQQYVYQCEPFDVELTAGDKKLIAEREAKKKAAEEKRKKEEAEQEVEGKKAYCKIAKQYCYDTGKLNKNYGDKSNTCYETQTYCTKEESAKMCADAKKNNWRWQCK